VTVWRELPFGGASISGTPAVGETLHAAAPAGAALQWVRAGSPIAGAAGSDYEVQSVDQGYELSCRITPTGLIVPGTPLPPRPTLTRIAFWGDSYTAGANNGDSPATRFSTVAAAALGVGEDNGGISGQNNFFDFGASGEILGRVYNLFQSPAAAPYTPNWMCSTVQLSVNNLNHASLATNPAACAACVVASVRRLRTTGCYAVQRDSAMYTLVGPTDDLGASTEFLDDGSWTLAVPEDFPGGRLRAVGRKFAASGAVETITVDDADVPAGSVDNHDGVVESPYTEPWQLGIPGIPPGAHSVRGDVSSVVVNEQFMGVDFEAAGVAPPLVIVLNCPRCPAYPVIADNTPTDAQVTAMNAALASQLATEFSSDASVPVLIDVDALLGKDPANFGADGLHPNATGNQIIADAIVAAVEENY
jgi:lysophospholipase L1-like esterase